MIPIALEDELTVPAELKSTVTYWPILHEEDMNTDKLFELLGKDFDVLSFQSFSLFLGSSIRNTVQEK